METLVWGGFYTVKGGRHFSSLCYSDRWEAETNNAGTGIVFQLQKYNKDFKSLTCTLRRHAPQF